MTRLITIGIIGVLLLGGAGVAGAQDFEFKGLVLGSKSSVQALEGEHSLKCDTAHRSQYGIQCRGASTFLGQKGALEVDLSNQEVITRINVRYESNLLKYKDMRKSFYEKFGRPQRQSGYTDEWRKGQGKVEQQWIKLTPETLEMRVVRLNTPTNPNFLLREKIARICNRP